jgi:hypothetical protein
MTVLIRRLLLLVAVAGIVSPAIVAGCGDHRGPGGGPAGPRRCTQRGKRDGGCVFRLRPRLGGDPDEHREAAGVDRGDEGKGRHPARHRSATRGYYYAHFSQFVGEPRAVAKGEISGLAGMTGNASAPHLHFEIRLGGPNGNRTNPYPTLKSAGC